MEANEYPWGNNFDLKRCNSLESNTKGTTPVGAYSPQGDSAFGTADMAGNVWEWTRNTRGGRSLFSSLDFNYPYRFDDGREDDSLNEAVEHIVRGGSFSCDKGMVRCAKRGWLWASYTQQDIGFRVAICPTNK